MHIDRQAPEWGTPSLPARDTDGTDIPVPIGGWEASFDGRQTWLPSRDNGHGQHAWLIAGPDYPGGGDDPGPTTTDHIVPDGPSRPVHFRLRDAPETLIPRPLWLGLL